MTFLGLKMIIFSHFQGFQPLSKFNFPACSTLAIIRRDIIFVNLTLKMYRIRSNIGCGRRYITVIMRVSLS